MYALGRSHRTAPPIVRYDLFAGSGALAAPCVSHIKRTAVFFAAVLSFLTEKLFRVNSGLNKL